MAPIELGARMMLYAVVRGLPMKTHAVVYKDRRHSGERRIRNANFGGRAGGYPASNGAGG